MASSKNLSVFLLFALLSSIHTEARDSQMFNKIPSKTNEPENQIPLNKDTYNNPNEQQPNFLPENENSYGLYAHESLNLPPSSVTPNNNNNNNNNNNDNNDNSNNFPINAKYLPKNYNPVAYVTQPEDFNEESTFSEKGYSSTQTNNNNYENNGENKYYNAHQKDVKVFDFMDRDEENNRNYNNYNNYNKDNDGNNNYNNYNNRFMDATFSTNPSTRNNNYNRFGGRVNRVQPQGMSDTRFLENGRYYYDINSEKYSVHPNENAMRNQYNQRGMYGNHNANSYQYNNFNDEQVQYQDDNMP